MGFGYLVAEMRMSRTGTRTPQWGSSAGSVRESGARTLSPYSKEGVGVRSP